MRTHIIDDLRPEPVDIDPDWDEQTLRAIMRDGELQVSGSPRRWRWPVRLAAVAAGAALIAGSAAVARNLLPADDVRPAEVAHETPVVADGPFAKELARLDETFPTTRTDETFEAVGTRSFPLGKAPADDYIFYKLAFECADGATYLYILNGDRNAASATCDADDGITSTAGEMTERVAAGSENVVTIDVNQELRYIVTVGYRSTSIQDVGPRGTLPDGRTYGPMTGQGDEPDLVRVIGVAGVEGYAESKFLGVSRLGASTEEMRRMQQRYRDGERVDRTIPVVDTQGRQVDVFEIMLQKPR